MASLNQNTAVLGQTHAKHLLRRASFAYTKTLIDQFAALTPQQALDALLADNPLTLALPFDPGGDGFWTESTALPNSFNGQDKKATFVSAWWWYNAINSPTLKYKLSHFLSTRFTASKQTATATEFYDHVRLLLFSAYGNYKTLAHKITVDNLMLVYLDNTTNDKNSPNENYAREFLELFTIGKGIEITQGDYTNYTETDIVQAARVLTGFRRQADRSVIDAETGIPKGVNLFIRHHTSPKVFSSDFNNTTINSATDDVSMDAELDAFIDMVFNKMATAQHVCRKLYGYFVKSTITAEVETDIITPLAQQFYNTGYEIAPVIRTLLESQHFYDLDDADASDETIGGIIKSPLQEASEICTFFQATIPDPTIDPATFYVNFYRRFLHDTFFGGANMLIFQPENVAGHSAYYQAPDFDKTWISSSTLIARYRLGESLLDGVDRIASTGNIGVNIDIVNTIRNGGIVSDASDAYVLTADICNYFFPQNPDSDRINYFMNSFLLAGFVPGYWTDAWNTYVNSNDSSVVEPRLRLLLTKILSAPESQLF